MKPDTAGGWSDEPGNGHEQCSLAAAGGSDEGNKFLGLNSARDVSNRESRLAIQLAVRLGEILDL